MIDGCVLLGMERIRGLECLESPLGITIVYLSSERGESVWFVVYDSVKMEKDRTIDEKKREVYG